MPATHSPSAAAPRRFHLLDLIALIAATAVGLAVAKVCWDETADSRYHLGGELAAVRPAAVLQEPLAISVPFLAAGAWPIVAAWTLTLILLGLRRPGLRPGRPGRAPSLAAASTIVLMSLAYPLLFRAQGFRDGHFVRMVAARLTYDLPPLVGAAVLGAWWTLLWGGQFRPGPSWLDRSERVLEACWMLLAVLALWANYAIDLPV